MKRRKKSHLFVRYCVSRIYHRLTLLIDYTVQEYLVKIRSADTRFLEQMDLARICLRFLSSYDVYFRPTPIQPVHPFLEYAFLEWATFVQFAQDEPSTLPIVMNAFQDTKKLDTMVQTIEQYGRSPYYHNTYWAQGLLSHSSSLLHILAGYVLEKLCRDLLDTDHIPLNAVNTANRTPLYIAAINGCADVVQLLLRHSELDVNIADINGRTPLIIASERGHTDVVRVLLTSEVVLIENESFSALTEAASEGHAEVVRLLLGSGRADGNIQLGDAYPPLLTAVVVGSVEVVRALLLDGKVNTEIEDKGGQTPLSVAVNYGRTEIAQLLIEVGNADVNSRDNDGRTPLFYAVAFCHAEIVKYLVQTGKIEDMELRDNSGRTPMEYALLECPQLFERIRYDEIAQYIVVAKAHHSNAENGYGDRRYGRCRPLPTRQTLGFSHESVV